MQIVIELYFAVSFGGFLDRLEMTARIRMLGQMLRQSLRHGVTLR